MKKASTIIIILLLAAIVFLQYGYRTNHGTAVGDTVVLVRRDTTIDTITQTIIHQTPPKQVTVLRHDTVKDTVLAYESKVYQDTLDLGGGKAFLTTFVSGVDVSLDSTRISAEIAHTNTTVEKTVYIDKKHSRWAVGPTVGVGYGTINNKLDVYVGIAVTYNLWKR